MKIKSAVRSSLIFITIGSLYHPSNLYHLDQTLFDLSQIAFLGNALTLHPKKHEINAVSHSTLVAADGNAAAEKTP